MNFINLQKAVVEIRQACAGVKDNQRTPFFFIVGAGISYPSIPIASELVKRLKDSAREYGHQDEPPGKEPVDAYAHWFQAAYPQRIDRQGFLRSLIEKKPITHANLRLAHLLLGRTVTNLVVTPNFDDFLTSSLQLFGKYHVICDHPKTVERIDHEQGDIQIVHVHGTYSFYDCCNLRGEIEGQAKPSEEYSMGFLLDQVMYRRSPLVVGYSGWDGDVITTAIHKRLNQGRLPRKVYWFCYKRTDADKVPQWVRDRGQKPDDDVCFVVPEEEAGRGEPVGTRSDLAAARGPIDPERGERGLDAKDVFAALIEAFQLKAPSLTSDPLGFFAGHLRASLPDSSDQGVDIYFIPKVIEKIERARELERAAAEQRRHTEAALESVLEAVRSSRYRDVVAATRTLAPELDSLEQEQLSDLMDAVWSAAMGLYDNSQEEMDGYDLVVAIGDVLLKGGRDDPALRERMAEALVNKGFRLGALNRSDDAVAVYDEVVKRFGDATEPAVRGWVAWALFGKGVTLGTLSRSDEEVAVYDEVVKRFGDATEPAVREQVARALVNKGFRLGALSRSDEEVAVYDEVVKRFGDATEPAVREQVARALVNKGFRLGALSRSDEEVAVYDEVVKRFGDATEPAVRGWVAWALVNKGVTLGTLSRSDDAVAVYDEVVKRFGDATEPAVREQVARALVNKGVTLGTLSRSDEEVAVYDEVVKRFGDATEPAVREQVASALVSKGVCLGALNRSEEEVAVYDEVVKRFGDATEPALREWVGSSLNGIGFGFLCDAKRMWAAGDEPAARDCLFGAEEKLRAGLDCVPDGPEILGNLGYAVFLSGRLDEARELLVRAIRLGGEKLRQGELDDAAIHPLPQDQTFKELVRSIPRPETEVEEE